MTARAFFHHLGWMIQRQTICRIQIIKHGLVKKEFDSEPKAPYLFLGNHANLSDPWYFGGYCRQPVAYMANEQGFVGFKNVMAFLSGAFPKKKGEMDAGAVRKALSINAEGECVGIFPEGDRCWDGRTAVIFPKIVKLARKFRCSLRLGRVRGSYLSWPRWAKHRRKGKIFLEFKTLPYEDILKLSDEVLYKIITESLTQNDIKDGELKSIRYHGRALAEGIEHLLWKCPSCKSEDTLFGEGNLICCEACNKNWKLDGHLRVTGEAAPGADLLDWCEWEKKFIHEALQKGHGIASRSITIGRVSEGRRAVMSEHGFGDLHYEEGFIRFTPRDGSTPLAFETKKFDVFVDHYNKNFDFRCAKESWRVLFKGRNALKWIELLKLSTQGSI